MNRDFKPLYKRTKSNAIQVCNISVENDEFIVDFGQLYGKMQQNRTKCYPKNVGRSNETTGNSQALIEAEAKWKSKVKGGYSESVECNSEVLLPMKVKTYQGQEKNVIFPCYVSPKLNGVNGEYRLENGELKLYSRGGNEYPMLEHHVEPIMKALESLGTNSVNGELYIHGEHLQDITGAVKKFKAHITPRVEFKAFDLPNLRGDYHTRSTFLMNSEFDFIDVVTVNNHEAIDSLHEIYTKEGYEGIIIRNASGSYEYNTRSSDVFKYKVAQDAEFKTVGFALDKNKHAVFVCVTPGGREFSVKLKGTSAERLKMAEVADSYIGQWLKIEFETFSKDLIPLKPVGIMFRACDSQGNPIE